MFKFPLVASVSLLFAASAFAQGIDFQHGSWDEVKARAAKENKAIFVDAYASWCGPCKWLSAEVFPKESVGTFFNKNFISFKLDAESEGDGVAFAQEYGIAAYPTLFYFDSKGELVHRTVGAMEAEDLIKAAGNALDPNKQLYTLKKRFDGGEKDPEFLYNCADALFTGGESEAGAEAANAYFAAIPKDKWASKRNLDLIVNIPTETDSELFRYVLDNKKAFSDMLGADTKQLYNYIDYVFLLPIYEILASQDKVAFEQVKADITKNAGDEAKRLNAKADYYFYVQQGVTNKTFSYIANYIDNYSNDTYELNEVAWMVFEQAKSKKHLQKALEWVNESVELEASYMNIDTQANLLYKLKRYPEAKTAAEAAIAKGKEADAEGDFSATEQLLEEINKQIK